MHLIDSEPQAWFLLQDGDSFLLDVNCSYSAASFDMVLLLSADEKQGYMAEGRAFISRLADAVQQHALTTYNQRNVAAKFGREVHEAILRQRAADPR